MRPEFHALLFAVDVCATESLFVHVTESPTLRVIGFGENAVVVRKDAPDTMLAAAVAPVVVVVVVVPVVVELGVPVEFELLLPQAAAERTTKATAITRPICIRSPLRESPHANTLPRPRAYSK